MLEELSDKEKNKIYKDSEVNLGFLVTDLDDESANVKLQNLMEKYFNSKP